jgi:hypothetical protein
MPSTTSTPVNEPTPRWELTAPESYVLLHGLERRDPQPFKLALMELVARDVFRLVTGEEPGAFGIRRPVSVLQPGVASTVPSERPLAAAWRIVKRSPRQRLSDGTVGMTLPDVVFTAQRRYVPLAKFITKDVAPALVARGYLFRPGCRWLGSLRRGPYELTSTGRAAQADLLRRLELAQSATQSGTAHDRVLAISSVGLLGAASLLLSDLSEGGHDLRGKGFDSSAPEDFVATLMALEVGFRQGMIASSSAVERENGVRPLHQMAVGGGGEGGDGGVGHGGGGHGGGGHGGGGEGGGGGGDGGSG